jgi:TolA-binding protein
MKKLILLIIFFVIAGAGCTKQETKPTIQTQNNTVKQEQATKSPEELEEAQKQELLQKLIDEGVPIETEITELTEEEKSSVDSADITEEDVPGLEWEGVEE